MPDGANIAADLSAPPHLRKTTASERSSQEPIFVEAISSGGPRIHYLARLAEFKENIWGVQTHQVANAVLGTSAGSMLALGLTMPCAALDGGVPDAQTLRPILLDASREILTKGFYRDLRPYSINRARAVLKSHWGDVTFQDARTGVGLFTQSKNKSKKGGVEPHFFSNISDPKKRNYSHVPVFEAGAAAMAMPVAFKANVIEGVPMYDGAFRRALPIKQAVKLARQIRGDTKRPIVVLGTTAGFSYDFGRVTKWIQGRTPREQIDKQKLYLERQIAKGDVDESSFIIDVPACRLIPGISSSFTDVSEKAYEDMVKAADVTAEIVSPSLLRLKSRLGLTAEI